MTIYLFIDPLATPCYEAEQAIEHFKMLHPKEIKVQIVPIVNQQNIQEAVKTRSVLKEGSPLEIQNLLYLNVYHSCLAFIAASMQGRRKAHLLLSAIQETVINLGEIFTIDLLMDIASKLNLDAEEFKNDFYSTFAKEIFERNQQLAHEMNVTSTPTCIVELNSQDVHYQLKGAINIHTLSVAYEKLKSGDFDESNII